MPENLAPPPWRNPPQRKLPLEAFLPTENSPLENIQQNICPPPPENVYLLQNNKLFVKMGNFYDLKSFPLGLWRGGVTLYLKV